MRLSISSDIESEISTRTVPPNRRRCNSSSTASSRSSASSETSKSASLVTRNGAHSVISIFGKSDVSEYVITCSRGRKRWRLPTLMKRGRSSGTLTRAKRSSPRLRIPDEHAERQRQRGDVRERLAGPDRERRQHGIDLPVEERRELFELLLGAVRDPADADPFLLERRAQLLLPEARLLGRQREHPLADLGQRLLRRASVQRVNREARRVLAHEAADAHREELVEVLGEPRAERQALEERETRVGGELEDALVEVERGQLAVEEPLRPLDGGFLLLHGRH